MPDDEAQQAQGAVGGRLSVSDPATVVAGSSFLEEAEAIVFRECQRRLVRQNIASSGSLGCFIHWPWRPFGGGLRLTAMLAQLRRKTGSGEPVASNGRESWSAAAG